MLLCRSSHCGSVVRHFVPKVSQTPKAKIQCRLGRTRVGRPDWTQAGGETMNLKVRWLIVVVLGTIGLGPAMAPALPDQSGTPRAIGATTPSPTVPPPLPPFPPP